MNTTQIIIAAIVAVIVVVTIVLIARRKPGQIEGQGVSDEIAAAVEDVAGEFLGVDAHHDRATDGLASPPPPTGHPSTIALEPTPVIADDPDLPADDLTRLKGLGPKAAALLNEAGIRRYAQLGALDAAGIARVDAAMGSFAGRITRDRWVEQARFLAADDIAGFEAQFGKLG